jgi:hypothetical protein
MKLKSQFVAVLFVITALGCGGSSQKGPTELSGVLIDSPVQGISYTTTSGSGTTDASGAFQFQEGESVRFFLGDIDLGEITGQNTVNPFDLAGIAPPTDAHEIRTIFNTIQNNLPNSFTQAANLTVFLQNLDQDQDTSNGIVVPDGVSALTSGLNVSFDDPLFRFPQNAGFRNLVRATSDAGLFTAGPFQTAYGNALDHLYAALELTPEIYRESASRNDSNGDGVFEQSTRTFYNAAGLRERTETDTNNDGTVDRVDTDTYNERNQLIRSESDTNNDGVPDRVGSIFYDEFGMPVRQESDNNNDGTPDAIYTTEYDALGNRIRTTQDNNGDGTLDRVEEYTYDENNDAVSRRVDTNGDGTFDASFQMFYDANHNLIRTESDTNNDGTVDHISTDTFNENNQRVRSENDTNADGTPDSISSYFYDTNGFRTRSEYDTNADGTPDRVSTSQFDEFGNEILYQQDDNNDGVIDSTSSKEIDSFGNPIRYLNDSNADGTPDSIFETDYELGNWQAFFERLFT